MNAPTIEGTLDVKGMLEQSDIKNRAMLFRLQRGGTTSRIRDKGVEQDVAATTGESGWFVSRGLFQDKSNLVGQYQKKAGEMYAYHIRATLPWGDDSSRLLPNDCYFEYTTRMQNYISELSSLRSQILTNWDTLVADDVSHRNMEKIRNGKNADANLSDYPSALQMEHKLYVNWYPKAISDVEDLRFLTDDMKVRAQAAFDEALASASRDLYTRMLFPVTAFIEKLAKYNGEKGERFSSSFLDNLHEMTQQLPKLNLQNDPVIDQLIVQINDIIKPYVFQPDALKESPTNREAVKAKLEALESTLKGYAI